MDTCRQRISASRPLRTVSMACERAFHLRMNLLDAYSKSKTDTDFSKVAQ